MKQASSLKSLWLPRLLLVASLAFSLPALAADPWVGVPSAANGQKVQLKAGSLQAWQPVTLLISDPQGRQSQQTAVANAKGDLTLDVQLAAAGAHKLELLDANGKRIGGGTCLVSR
ncbi:hypothetical protein [Roseateles oligotrophus]|uniref:Uncharacterized protein n=1 Tax=Roseateles oligotrophus TaxID=1769250 RepID=A0ABT2YLJ1_9BURK|nr:hypothetical protein [Roseateles oligotrophus]MCV2370940.1 hypothetical protein [Roseateles oligotrophus]